jgi:uncharacterized membrane protein (UPF0127 family)
MKEGVLLADGHVLVPRARRADGPFERARGLLARPAPTPGEALLIAPCSGIHTCAMAYPIDAAFLDRRGRVLRVAVALVPWRFAACREGHAVVELAAGEAACLGIVPGMALEWRETAVELQ